eukprot:1763521-Pyramimonas_sp.AAC.1
MQQATHLMILNRKAVLTSSATVLSSSYVQKTVIARQDDRNCRSCLPAFWQKEVNHRAKIKMAEVIIEYHLVASTWKRSL